MHIYTYIYIYIYIHVGRQPSRRAVCSRASGVSRQLPPTKASTPSSRETFGV